MPARGAACKDSLNQPIAIKKRAVSVAAGKVPFAHQRFVPQTRYLTEFHQQRLHLFVNRLEAWLTTLIIFFQVIKKIQLYAPLRNTTAPKHKCHSVSNSDPTFQNIWLTQLTVINRYL